MKLKQIRYRLLLALLFVVPLFTYAGTVKITQQGSGKYSVGETFTVIIQIDDLRGGGNIPQFKGCNVVGNSSSQFQTIEYDARGRAHQVSQIKNIVTLQAVSPGNYTYGPISVNGTRSNTISYNIGGSAAPVQTSSSASSSALYTPAPFPSFTENDNGLLIVKATVSDSSPYIQQPVRYTVRVFSIEEPRRYPQIEDPKTDNAIFEVLPDNSPRQISTTTINGRTYYYYELYTMLVYPSKTGDVTIFGGNVTDNVFGYGSVSTKCNDVVLKVKELPDLAKHPDVNGVGSYNVSSTLQTKKARAGEPIQLTFTVKGLGNPSYVSLPDIADQLPAGIKFIKSESKIDKNITAGNIDGTITFECVLMPSKAGDYEIPAVTFTFFNPDKREWYTKSTKPFKISVDEADASDANTGNKSFNSEYQSFTPGQQAAGFMISSLLYWLCYIVPVIALIIVLIYYKRRMALYADRDLLKQKRANSMARKRLRAAENAMKANQRDLFYDELLKAVWGYLGDKLSMPTSELSRANIREQLLSIGVDGDVANDIIAFIDDCEFAKYASASDSDMRSGYQRASAVINEVESEINKKVNNRQTHTDDE
ncbi:MAG: BatD family protein [Muribaculaceae bacterium]|nr:BatD family protein [Muribaculaceae bacterium]